MAVPGVGIYTPIYGLYRYMPQNRVWFLRLNGVFFLPFFCCVPGVDRVAKLYLSNTGV